MQLASAVVRLGGSRDNTVHKVGLTVAEIVVLRAIHGGDDSVTDIQPTGMDKRPHAEELNRLRSIYGNAKDDKEESILTKIFPGASPNLPVNLKDIGLDIAEPEDPAAVKASK